ncbi:outer membrane protein assembly factor BamC [Parashewanella spongiae]|uniref:Outer membrane protein assembly factor BamC n=1 Tax=Parashewanella spongiae TaxID=342950 RepID=A0A3A6TLT4_9GAMM|nr:outer membrane protein assembly factor BamC [Parashewanella spongiae]MCL1079053.1 outer membrane protein assembly factor BamC [Parashewanella spongiae]RJY11415.1 outer membrane protein assembly factor BamC [Parashewanella spongiae]
MFKKLSPVVLIATITACSTPLDRRQANGDHEYLNAKTEGKLVIPEGLKDPDYNDEFKIPSVVATKGKHVGSMLDIRPPLQVLATAEGTRVVEGADNIKVVVESIDPDINLKSEIISTLQSFFVKRDITILKKADNPISFETDWIEKSQIIESSMWGADKVYHLKQRYEFIVNVKPHGRTGDITIKLIDHQENYNGAEQKILLSGEDKRRYTIDMLNSAISYFSTERTALIKAKRKARSLGIATKVISTSEDTHWVSNAPFDKVWQRLRIVLPEVGFEIIDIDTSKGLYFVEFKNNEGFWSSLWGDDHELLLEDGTYRITVEEGDDNTSIIKLRDKENEPLSTEVINSVGPALSKLMEENRG